MSVCQFEKKSFWNFSKKRIPEWGDVPYRPTKTNSRLDPDWETWEGNFVRARLPESVILAAGSTAGEMLLGANVFVVGLLSMPCCNVVLSFGRHLFENSFPMITLVFIGPVDKTHTDRLAVGSPVSNTSQNGPVSMDRGSYFKAQAFFIAGSVFNPLNMKLFSLKLITKKFDNFTFIDVTHFEMFCEVGDCNLNRDGVKSTNPSNSHCKPHFLIFLLRKFAQRELRLLAFGQSEDEYQREGAPISIEQCFLHFHK